MGGPSNPLPRFRRVETSFPPPPLCLRIGIRRRFLPQSWHAGAGQGLSRSLFGMNFRSLPGIEYPIGVNFSHREMPTTARSRVVVVSQGIYRLRRVGGQVWLNFDGINYRANIWLNGKRIADTNEVVGAYRTYRFNVTDLVKTTGKPNVLAVEVFAPTPDRPGHQLGGLESRSARQEHGPVARCLSSPPPAPLPCIIRKSLPKSICRLDNARLTVSADLENPGPIAVKATVVGTIEGVRFEQNDRPGSGRKQAGHVQPGRISPTDHPPSAPVVARPRRSAKSL